MLSKDYLHKFEETLGQIKSASGANRFIGMLRPFSNKTKFDAFSKQLAKNQPWMAKADLGATDMLRHMQETHPVKSIASRISGYNDLGIKRHGETFKKDFFNKHPEQFAAAQKKLQNQKMLQGAGLGAGGLLAGKALLTKPDQDQYSY